MTTGITQPRVLLVLATSEGGIGRHVRSLAAGLTDRGCTVGVAGPQSTNERFGFDAVGALFAPVEISTTARPATDLRAVVALRTAITDAGIQIIHAHGLRAAALTKLARKKRHPPLVVTWHNAILATGPKRLALSGLERLAARSADVTLGASRDLVERARELGAKDARLGPVAAPPLPAPVRSRDEARATLGGGERPVVLAMGRLAPQKSYGLLLDAATLWRARDRQPLVVIAGDGPERAGLAERIAAEDLPVRLLGHRDDIAELLAASDVVVITSRWEARALIAQEALRIGRPLVATAVGGIPDLVGDAAVLVPYGDAGALASAVSNVIDDPNLSSRLADAGPREAATWPTEADMIDSLYALYQSIVPSTLRSA